MIRDRLLVAALPCVLVVPTASADLPLTIEELLTAERRWRADVNLVYANSDRRDINSRLGAIQVGSGQFITIPVSVGQARQNTDFLALSIGARYGMRLNTELYGRVSALSQDTRTLDADGAMSDSEQQFADAWMGVNHRFSDDNDTPALLGFFELALVVIFSSQSVMATSLDKQDMAFAFGSEGIASEMLALSQQEMEETEGQNWVWAARFGWGAVSGGVSYTVSNYGTDNWNVWGFGQSVLYGGIGGLFGWNAGSSATLGAGSSAALNRWAPWSW